MLLRQAELHGLVLGAEHVVVPMPCWGEEPSWKVMLSGENLNGFALKDTDFVIVSHGFEEFLLLEREKIPELSKL